MIIREHTYNIYYVTPHLIDVIKDPELAILGVLSYGTYNNKKQRAFRAMDCENPLLWYN